MRASLSAVALVAALALATPVHAAGLSGMGSDLFGNYFHFGRPNLEKPPVKGISVGSLKIQLQHTKLAQVQKAFGGTIQTQGSEGSLANWLCYHTDGSKGPAADTWFISNTLGGGEFIMIVAVQAADPDRMPADCQPAPAKFSLPQMGIPGLGAPINDLKTAFGAAGGGKITYRADVPAADALGTALTAQYIAYLMDGSQVAGYGAGETAVANVK